MSWLKDGLVHTTNNSCGPLNGGRIEPANLKQWGLRTDSKQNGELQLPTVPNVESGEGFQTNGGTAD